MSRATYIEFDLEAMFAGEIYPNFVTASKATTAAASRGEGRPRRSTGLRDEVRWAQRQPRRLLERKRSGSAG